MLIDWFTVGAQALNFLILVWLMKRFLYRPILNAIDAREQKIAAELADADAKKTEAQKERDEFERKNAEFDQQRAALLTKATEDANAERARLLDEARKAADALSAKRQESLIADAHNLNQAISRRTQQEVFAITRKTLADLATVSLEERLGEVFTRRLHEMNGEAKSKLGDALKTASDPALLRSAFDLPAEQRAAIQNALNETFAAQVRVRFETAPDLVSGIELSANGQKVAWSIADYLASLEKGVEELLKEQDKPEPKSNALDDLTPKIAKRAYELYEQGGRKSSSANQNWSQAEREIRKGESEADQKLEAKAEPKTEVKVEPKPDAKTEPKSEDKIEPKSETAPAPKDEAEPKTEAPTAPKPDAKVEPKIEPKSELKSEPKPEAKATPEAEAEPKHEEPKLAAKAS